MRLPVKELGARHAAQFLFVMLAAGFLKLYYSAAGPNDLRWILWPTAMLTELVTGTRFYFESHAGYMSADRSFLIAAPCSGVNFLITAFLLLSLLKLRRRPRAEWRHFVFAGAAAYLITIVANSARIAVSLWLNYSRPSFLGLGREELHRLDGISVFFGFLLLICVIAEPRSKAAGLTNSSLAPRVKRAVFDRTGVNFKRYVLPLAVYYGMTLGIPVVNGATEQSGEFWEHAVFVFVTPILMIAAAAAFGRLFRLYRQRKRIAAAASALPGGPGTNQARAGLDVRDTAAAAVPARLKGRAVIFDRQM